MRKTILIAILAVLAMPSFALANDGSPATKSGDPLSAESGEKPVPMPPTRPTNRR